MQSSKVVIQIAVASIWLHVLLLDEVLDSVLEHLDVEREPDQSDHFLHQLVVRHCLPRLHRSHHCRIYQVLPILENLLVDVLCLLGGFLLLDRVDLDSFHLRLELLVNLEHISGLEGSLDSLRLGDADWLSLLPLLLVLLALVDEDLVLGKGEGDELLLQL